MKKTSIATVLLLLTAGVAYAVVDQLVPANQNFQGHSAYHLMSPGSTADPATSPELHGGHASASFPASQTGLYVDVPCASDGFVPQRAGGAMACGLLPASSLSGLLQAGQFPVLNGAVTSTGASLTTAFGAAGPLTVLVNATNGTAVPTFLGPGSALQVLSINSGGTAIAWQALTPSFLGSEPGLSVLGVTGASSAPPAPIVAPGSGTTTLVATPTSVTWGALPIAGVSGVYAATNGLGPTALGTPGVATTLARSDQTQAAYRSDLPLSTTWFVDPVSGSDSAACTSAATACATLQQIKQRWWGAELKADTTVSVLGNVGSTDTGSWNVDAQPAGSATHPVILLLGSLGATTGFGGRSIDNTLYTGTVTSFTAASDSPSATDSELTDTAIPTSFTASGLMAKGVLCEDTTLGVYFWLAKDLGSKTVRISPPALNAQVQLSAALTPGDAYKCFQEWTVPTQDFGATQGYFRYDSVFENTAIAGTVGTGYDRRRTWLTVSVHPIAGRNGMINDVYDVTAGNGNLGGTAGQAAAGFVGIEGGMILGNGSSLLTIGGVAEIGWGLIQEGAAINVDDGLLRFPGPSVGQYDLTVPALQVIGGSTVDVSQINSGHGFVGKNNTSKLVFSSLGFAKIYYGGNGATPPWFAGATSDSTPIQIQGTSYAVSALPAVENVTLPEGTPFPSTVFETGGPSLLTYGVVQDGRLVKRSASALVGAVAGTDFATTVRADGIATGTIQLASLNAAPLIDGQVAWVDSVGDFYRLGQSTLATTPTTVIAASGKAGYVWQRLGVTNQDWAVRTAWWVDPSNTSTHASDENTGASSSVPLLSFGELGRRLRGATIVQSTITVTEMSNGPNTDPLILDAIHAGGALPTINIIGVPTVIAGSRTISSPRNPAVTANDHFEITDIGATFTPWIQNFILHRTNGTPAWFWPYKDLGSGHLQISPPINPASLSAIQTLTNGDTYEVLQLPTFADVFMTGGSSLLSVTLSELSLIGAVGVGTQYANQGGLGALTYDRVLLNSVFPVVGLAEGYADIELENICIPAAAGGAAMQGPIAIWGGLFAGNGTSTAIEYTEGYSLGGNASNVMTLGGVQFQVVHDGRFEKMAYMAYDFGAAWAPVTVTHFARAWVTGIGGERNAGQLLVTDSNGNVGSQVFANWNPAATSSPSPYNVQGALYTQAQLGLNTNKLATTGGGIFQIESGAWAGDLAGDSAVASVVGLTGGGVDHPIDALTAGQALTVSSGTGHVVSAPFLGVPGSPGLLAWTGSIVAARTLASSTLTLVNPGGVAGNPSVDLTPVIAASSCTNCNLSYDQYGRITVAGSGGGGLTANLPLVIVSNVLSLQFDNSTLVMPTTALVRGHIAGDVDVPSGSNTSTLHNIPTGTTAAGNVVFTETGAPSAPAAGHVTIWANNGGPGHEGLFAIDSSGDVTHGMLTQTCGPSTWMNQSFDGGGFTCTQPAIADVSGLTAALDAKQNLIGWPTASFVLVSSGPGVDPTGSADMTFGGHVLTLANSGLTSVSIELDQAAAQEIDKTNGALFVGTADAHGLGLYANGLTRGWFQPGGAFVLGQGQIYVGAATPVLQTLGNAAVEWALVPPSQPTAGIPDPAFVLDNAALAFTGNTHVTSGTVGLAYLKSPTVTNGTPVTIDDPFTFAIAGAPFLGGSVTAGDHGPISLWVQSGLTQLDGPLAINGVTIPSNQMFIAGHTTESNRDSASWFLGGGSGSASLAGDYLHVFTSSTALDPASGIFGNLITATIERQDYTASSAPNFSSSREATSLWVKGKPTLGGNFTNNPPFGYTAHFGEGTVRFDGDSTFGFLNGPRVFEVPANTNHAPAGILPSMVIEVFVQGAGEKFLYLYDH